jgi:hypothetical protein
MGQEIRYCSRCQTRLLGSEFEKGKAFKFGDKSACAACAKEMLAALPEAEREAVLAANRDARKASSGRLATQQLPESLPSETPSRGTRPSTESSTRIKTAFRRTVPGGRPGMVAAVAAGAAIGVVLLIFVLAGIRRPSVPAGKTPSAETAALPAVPAANSAPVPVEPPRPPAPRPIPAAEREAAARKSLQEARDLAREKPGDLAGQLERFKKARWDADGTPLLAEAQKELDQIQKRIVDGLVVEIAPIGELARVACGREEFKQAIDTLEQARSRFAIPEWSALLDAKIQQVRADAQKAYAPLREEALQARRSGTEDKVKAVSERIARWGLPVLSEDLARVLAEKTPVSAPPPTVPAELAAYRRRWEEALAGPLAVRDYAGAVRELERAAPPVEEKTARDEYAQDLENLRQAAALLGDTLHLLAKWPKGKSLVVSYLGERGDRLEVRGSLVRTDARGIEVLREGESFAVPLPEITAASLVEIFRGRAEANSEKEARAAAVFLALEGDGEAARKVGGDASAFPDKYWTRAAKPASDDGAREKAARDLFWKAEDEFRPVSTRAGAIGKFLALLSEHAETAFVQRNRLFIASRPEAAREYFFYPHDLAAAGTFTLVQGPKIPSFQTSAADSPFQKGRDNFVEIAFYALPETVYKGWIYAGACCVETFTFYAQATDLTAPDPDNPKGSIAAGPGDLGSVPIKQSFMSLRKTHAMHGGPKGPARWEWFEVPLPKFPAAGVKKARILSEQAGFSVAYMVVSAARKGSPGDAEMKEILKAHAALASTEGPWVRPSIPAEGLALWLRADAGAKIEGGAVARWTDQSGQGRDAIQADPARRPAWVPRIAGGRPALGFDGKDDSMAATVPVNGLSAITLVMVSSCADRKGGAVSYENAALFWEETEGWGDTYLSPFQTNVRWRFGTTQGGNLPWFNRSEIGPDVFTVTSVVKDGPAEALYLQGRLALRETGKFQALKGVGPVLGVGGTPRGKNFTGSIAEVLVYARALPDAERQRVEGYLLQKYFPAVDRK